MSPLTPLLEPLGPPPPARPPARRPLSSQKPMSRANHLSEAPDVRRTTAGQRGGRAEAGQPRLAHVRLSRSASDRARVGVRPAKARCTLLVLSLRTNRTQQEVKRVEANCRADKGPRTRYNLLGTSQVLEPPRATLSAPRERKGELASGGPVPETPWDLSHSATGTSPGGQRGHFPVGVPAARKRKILGVRGQSPRRTGRRHTHDLKDLGRCQSFTNRISMRAIPFD